MGACWLILFSLGWFFFAQWSNYLIGWFQESFCIPISQICSGWRYGLAIHQGSYHFRKCTCIIKLDSKCLAKADWSHHSFRWFILEANYAQTSKHQSKYIPVILSTKKTTKGVSESQNPIKAWNCPLKRSFSSQQVKLDSNEIDKASHILHDLEARWGSHPPSMVETHRLRSWRLSHWPSRIFHKWRWSSCRRRWFQEGFLEIPWEVVEMWVTTPLYHVAKSLGISQSFTRFTNLIPCEHHSSWCANVAMRVSDAASFDTPALSFQTKRSRDEILDDLKRIMKLKPKARWGNPRLIGFFWSRCTWETERILQGLLLCSWLH